MTFLRSIYLSFLKINREAARATTARAEHEGMWTAAPMGRWYSWLDDRIEAIEPTPLYCKKCGKETNSVHLWLCRDCFDTMGMAVEFDSEWTPEDL